MEQLYIVYEKEDGTTDVLLPNMECELSLEQIIEKDVPAGQPYKVVAAEQLPSEIKYYRSWYIDGENIAINAQKKEELEAGFVRFDRRELLMSYVDPVMTNTVRWNSMTEAQQQEWTAYRQALLDITEQAGFPFNVSWPTKPE